MLASLLPRNPSLSLGRARSVRFPRTISKEDLPNAKEKRVRKAQERKGKEREKRKKVFGRRFVREPEFNFCVCRTENNRVNLFGFCLVVTSVPFRRRRRVEVPSRKPRTSKRTIPLVFFLLSLCLEEKKRKKKTIDHRKLD